MNKDIERVVIRFDEENKIVFEDGNEDEIMTKIGNMEGVDVVSIQFKDGEVVNFTSGLMSCDPDEIHKGISAPGFHMSSCFTKEEAINEIKRLIE